jgi:hypothetical protein
MLKFVLNPMVASAISENDQLFSLVGWSTIATIGQVVKIYGAPKKMTIFFFLIMIRSALKMLKVAFAEIAF